MFDPKQLMEMQKTLQERFKHMQEDRETQVFDGSAGGGAVSAKVSGSYQVLELVVKPEAVDPDDIEMLQDLVIAAVNNALEKARESGESEMSKLTGGMKLPPFLGGGL